MERYSQFRDRGSGIAPFLPVPGPHSGFYIPFRLFLFFTRFPILTAVFFSYFFLFHWLPIGAFGKKASLWLMLGIPGIWWIDLQIDGVRKGSLAKHHQTRLPQPGSIIASSFTGPIDVLYLAAIFDPIFTSSYPSTPKVERISLLQAILRAFSPPQVDPPPNTRLTDIASLLKQYPNRSIAVFPECTATNGRGILQLSPSLTMAPPGTKIFPISLRCTPADVTTPIPGMYISFLWNLLSEPTHCIRVRIAENVVLGGAGQTNLPQNGFRPAQDARPRSYSYNYSDTLEGEGDSSSGSAQWTDGMQEPLTDEQQKILVRVGDALARLGRVKRVGLGVKEKQDFVKAWSKAKRRYAW